MDAIPTTPLKDVILFDTETTGISRDDEIVSIAICDGTGRILLNERFKPARHDTWPAAERVHHISPAQVAHRPGIRAYRTRITRILESGKLLAGYNIDFDLRMLRQSGIDTVDIDRIPTYDCMRNYARLHGEWDTRHNGWKWSKLADAAGHYGYRFDAHDAGEDIKATAYLYRHLTGNQAIDLTL